MQSTEPKFTKGPWHRGKSARFHNEIMDASGLTVATITEFMPRYRAGSDANAHLIAAAPDLYEALDDVIRKFDAAPYTVKSVPLGIMKARAALAKARGEVA